MYNAWKPRWSGLPLTSVAPDGDSKRIKPCVRPIPSPPYTLGAMQRSFSSFAALRLKAASLHPFMPSHLCACTCARIQGPAARQPPGAPRSSLQRRQLARAGLARTRARGAHLREAVVCAVLGLAVLAVSNDGRGALLALLDRAARLCV